MASWTSWKFPSDYITADNDSSPWTNPTNVYADDANFATMNTDYDYFGGTLYRSDRLRFRDFGFTATDIPANNSILGIEVGIEGGPGLGSSENVDVRIYGATAGDSPTTWNRSISSVWEGTNGGTSDLWGYSSFPQSDAIATTMGVEIRGKTSGQGDCDLWYVKIRFYHEPSSNYSTWNSVNRSNIAKWNGIAIASIDKLNGVDM